MTTEKRCPVCLCPQCQLPPSKVETSPALYGPLPSQVGLSERHRKTIAQWEAESSKPVAGDSPELANLRRRVLKGNSLAGMRETADVLLRMVDELLTEVAMCVPLSHMAALVESRRLAADTIDELREQLATERAAFRASETERAKLRVFLTDAKERAAKGGGS